VKSLRFRVCGVGLRVTGLGFLFKHLEFRV
jgi:hypothetical protein